MVEYWGYSWKEDKRELHGAGVWTRHYVGKRHIEPAAKFAVEQMIEELHKWRSKAHQR